MKKVLVVMVAVLLTFSTVAIHTRPTLAQGTTVQCGDIVEGEFTTRRQIIDYNIDLAPRDVLRVSGTVVGDFLEFDIQILAPSNSVVGNDGSSDFNGVWGSGTPSAETGVLGERGTYKIQITNYDVFGIYTLSIGCTLADGTTIEPGERLPDVPESSNFLSDVAGAVTPPSSFGGFGFPGLSPVDFSNGVTIPLVSGTPNTGSVSTGFDSIFGFSFEANEGDAMQLDFTRLSGNLNLGLVVLSADNQVAFQASLVTSESLSTRFTLPATGQYTIGVFRIDLVSPETPENTSFQIQAAVNP